MDRENVLWLLIDARYALKQCQVHDCADRAGDALERIVERLELIESQLPKEKPTGWLSTA